MALERLLDGPCYHMIEVFGHPEHIPVWHAAMRDEPVDWAAVFDGFVAVVDLPGCGRVAVDRRRVPGRAGPALDPELHRCLVAQRQLDDPRGPAAGGRGRSHGPVEGDVGSDVRSDRRPREDEAGSKAAYERHNAEVRAEVPAERLIEWQPEDGWAPLCAGLDLPVPDEPFPHTNTTADFRTMTGLDQQ